MPTQRQKNALRYWILGVGVAGLGALLSVFLAYQQLLSSEQVDRDRLTQAAKAASEALVRRIDGYTEIAFGLRTLFVVDPLVSRKAFTQAVEGLDLETRYPGIKNIAFTRYVRGDQKRVLKIKFDVIPHSMLGAIRSFPFDHRVSVKSTLLLTTCGP
jgi:CHASE1-domain containing sensor protein